MKKNLYCCFFFQTASVDIKFYSNKVSDSIAEIYKIKFGGLIFSISVVSEQSHSIGSIVKLRCFLLSSGAFC